MSSEATDSEVLGPITSLERVELIDAVRGFALFGVLLANQIWLSQDLVMTPERLAALLTAGIDAIAKHAVVFFVDWKFITLFSFLFGLGFAVQLIRAEERGRPIVGVYARRLSVLFLFGLLHAYLLWYGDILHFYALLGFGLILFRKASDRVLVIAGLVFAVAVPAVAQYVASLQPRGASADSEVRLAAFLSGDPVQVLSANFGIAMAFWTASVWMFILTMSFGKFLLGYYVGRKRLLQDAAEHLGLYRKLLWWGLGLGVVGNGVWVLTDILIAQKQMEPQSSWMLPARFMSYIGALAFAAFYLSGIVLLYQRPAWQRRIALLAPVGRMALTNYLLQTVFNLWIFYGYGLGLMGSVGAAFCVALSIVIFAVQIAYSYWWLKTFRFGPMEWLWRSLTYGKLQRMR